MRALHLITAILLVFQSGIGGLACGTAAPREPRVRIEHFKGTVMNAARLLSREHNVPVSIVEDTRDPGVELNRVDATPVDLLRDLARLSGVYRFESIDGHFVLYPDDPAFQSLVNDVHIEKEERGDAIGHLLEHLRAHAPSLPPIYGPASVVVGNTGSLFSAPVTLKSRDTAIRLLVQLLGTDQGVFFVVYKHEKYPLTMTLGSVGDV